MPLLKSELRFRAAGQCASKSLVSDTVAKWFDP